MPENSPMLQTDRLTLRRFREDDAAAAFPLLSDPVVNRFLPWFPSASVEDARAFLRERFLATYDAPIGYRYAICLRDSQELVGYVNVDPGEAHDLGYGIRRDFWGRGIATEAARALIERVREDGALPFLTATHDVSNPASGAVMRKLGMTYRYSYEELVQPKSELVTFRLYQLDLSEPPVPTYSHYWDVSKIRFVEKGL